jgi:uncharacterized DUF497 family protein
MTYTLFPHTDREFDWDQTKSDRNRLERGLPFDLAVVLFDRPTLERPDTRLDYHEDRIQAIGMIGMTVLACVYTDRGSVRRIISLRPASRRERDDYRAAFQN